MFQKSSKFCCISVHTSFFQPQVSVSPVLLVFSQGFVKVSRFPGSKCCTRLPQKPCDLNLTLRAPFLWAALETCLCFYSERDPGDVHMNHGANCRVKAVHEVQQAPLAGGYDFIPTEKKHTFPPSFFPP